ncbi:MAG TPA: PTS sugar transporter subunit IIA [Thermoanaerobaculia bacterium]|nr:PTS sugar transporter subunit IIA [Thermoanaerobaculia bacterium]
MDLKVRDVARLLNVSEQTVYRWVRGRALPAHRVHDQYHFNRVELQEWAALHKHRVSPELFAPNGSAKELPGLREAIERGGIYYAIAGQGRNDVLAAVTRLPGIPAGVDRQLLHQLLVAREALAPTSVGDGIAVPHPRDPVVVRVDQPAVFLCFLERPVDFGALDGRPVRVLFMLLSPTVRDHLQMLAKLAAALHDEEFKELLASAAPREKILDRLRAVKGERGQGC